MPNDSLDLEHLARLAMLEIPAEKVKSFTEDLDAIVKMAEKLPPLPAENEETPEEAAHDPIEAAALRADEVLPSLPRENLLQNAPQAKDGFFTAPSPME